MRKGIVGLAILGVLSYIIYKHLKKNVSVNTDISKNVYVHKYANVDIDPEVYKSANMNKESIIDSITTVKYAPGYVHRLNPTYTRTNYKAPYDKFGFGIDSARNIDSIDPDSYLHMPLESEGVTHTNKDLYNSVDDTEEYIPTFYKYIRIKFRGSNPVKIGGIRFLMSKEPIQCPVTIWNPHTGVKTLYSGDSLTDSDQKTFVFVFSEPVQVNRYEIKSGLEPLSSWIVEGSRNGTYWTTLDERVNVKFPLEGKVIEFFMRGS